MFREHTPKSFLVMPSFDHHRHPQKTTNTTESNCAVPVSPRHTLDRTTSGKLQEKTATRSAAHKSGVGCHCDGRNSGPDDLPRANVLSPSREWSAVLVQDLHGVDADLKVVRYVRQQLLRDKHDINVWDMQHGVQSREKRGRGGRG